MKTEFFEFYRPDETAIKELWSKATIVFDTNSLLNLYRTPSKARKEFLDVLDVLSARLWIPYQVGLEFQRSRLAVISGKGKTIEDALTGANALFEKIRDDVQKLELDKYDLDIETKPLIEQLEVSCNNLSGAISSVHDAQLAVGATDTIRATLDALFEGKVGPGPKDAAELEALIRDGERRYNEKIPPGFSDKDKEKNPNDSYFVHNGIRFERKYGDLIIWRQLINYINISKIEAVILVTADKKEDWWKREEGKTTGPHPELIRELRRETQINNFWMYSPDRFMSHAAQYANAKISLEALEEVRDVSRTYSSRTVGSQSRSFQTNPTDDFEAELIGVSSRESYVRTHRFVRDYLEQKFGEVSSGVFPDFEITLDGARLGFEIARVSSITSPPPHKLSSSIEALSTTSPIELKSIFLIVAIDYEIYRSEMLGLDRRTQRTFVIRLLFDITIEHDIGGVYLGVVNDEKFRPIYFEKGMSWDVLALENAL